MKLLVDENLPPRLIQDLADLFPDSAHVSSTGLGSSPDAAIWEYAKSHGFDFLTKDKDFANLSIAWGAPPKVILLQTGNCSTADLINLIRKMLFGFRISKVTPSEVCSSCDNSSLQNAQIS